MLAHLPINVLEALIECDWAKFLSLTGIPLQLEEVLHDDTARNEITDKMPLKNNPERRNQKRAVIYAHIHVDSENKTPSLNDLRKVRPYLDSYYKVCMALDIDKRPRQFDLERVREVDTAVLAPSAGSVEPEEEDSSDEDSDGGKQTRKKRPDALPRETYIRKCSIYR